MLTGSPFLPFDVAELSEDGAIAGSSLGDERVVFSFAGSSLLRASSFTWLDTVATVAGWLAGLFDRAACCVTGFLVLLSPADPTGEP